MQVTRPVAWTAALLFMLTFALPASAAVEHQFGGYWRTRFFANENFAGTDEESVTTSTSYALNTRTGAIEPRVAVSDDSLDLSRVDTRTRLYYTAEINDSLKLVNKFEMDAVWGGPKAGYGDVGADGKDFEIKNTYAEFNLGPGAFRVGVQPFMVSRGFTFKDDAAGALGLFTFSDGFTLGAAWIRWNEGFSNSADRRDKQNDEDVDGGLIVPTISIGKEITLQPSLLWVTADDGAYFGVDDTVNVYYLAFDADMSFDPLSLWFTGIYNGGTLESSAGDTDLAGYLLAAGVKVDVASMVDLHGQVVYSSGDDDAGDSDLDAFLPPPGAEYYWAELMGYGIFDEQVSAGSPADLISNVVFANLGATIKPMNKLSLSFDIWYAALAQDNAAGDSELGTELDLIVSYELVQGLKLDVVGAYLFAGDATYNGEADAHPYEVGTQLSLSF
jgi:hypothetical protein